MKSTMKVISNKTNEVILETPYESSDNVSYNVENGNVLNGVLEISKEFKKSLKDNGNDIKKGDIISIEVPYVAETKSNKNKRINKKWKKLNGLFKTKKLELSGKVEKFRKRDCQIDIKFDDNSKELISKNWFGIASISR